MKLNPVKFAALVAFAKKGGSFALAGNVLQITEEGTVKAYVNKLRREEPTLATWGVEPAEEEDPFGDLGETGFATVLIDTSTGHLIRNPDGKIVDPNVEVEEVKSVQPALREDGSVTLSKRQQPGEVIQRFRLKDADGIFHDLEVFSKSEHFGYILQKHTPKDIRTIVVKGKPMNVDVIALNRDIDGFTNGIENSKLLNLVELSL